MVRFLMDSYNVDVLQKNSYGISALTNAFQSGNIEVIELCLSHSSADEERMIKTDAPSGAASQEGDPHQQDPKDTVGVEYVMSFNGIESDHIRIRELPLPSDRQSDGSLRNPLGSPDDPESDSTGT